MKRLFISLIAIALTCTLVADDLNPFAYKLSAEYDQLTNSVTIGYHLNAPARKINIVIYKDEANPVTSKEFTASSYISTGAHTAVVPLAGVPGGHYSFKIEVYGKGQSNTTAFHKRLLLNSPFGIDIDNNTNSPYFGRTLITQPTTKNNTSRGIFEFAPADFTTNTSQVYGGDGISHNGGVNNYYQGTQGWYDYSHATPLRVRIAQDGTGRIFTTACDVDMNTYLWYVNPANLDQWTSLITAQQMNDIVDHPNNLNIHNISLDVRVDEQGKINLLLLSGTIEYGNGGVFKTGYIYSGKYVLPTNFPSTTTGTYTPIVSPNMTSGTISPHNYVKSGLLPVAINSSSQFDKYGGYWYCGSSQATEKDPFDNVAYKDKSALMHISTNGNLKHDYTSGEEYLKRNYTGSGGFRYNRDFTQVLVANGYRKTARLYNVSQTSATAHPTLSFVTELGTIFSGASNYITDFVWDHANNIYVVLRNGSSGYGIYTFATKYDAATPFVTRVPDGTTFEVICYDDVTYTLTNKVNDPAMGTISAGGEYKSCSEVEITATPKEGYRLLNWTINGTNFDSDGDNTYTVYMTDDMTVQANFGSAVFNVTWWNLFKNGEDISNGNTNLSGTNERLWWLFLIEWNAYLKANGKGYQRSPQRGGLGITNNQWMILSYLDDGNNSAGTDEDVIRDYMENFMDNSTSKSSMYWLGQYIEQCPTAKDINNNGTYNNWSWHLQAFINRVAKFYYSDCKTTSSTIDGYSAKDFSKWGLPDYWRPKWTKNACGLNETMNYSDNMPTSWTQSPCADGVIEAWKADAWKLYDIVQNPKDTWYKWNTGGANQLLAWREGGTDPNNNRIVHHVDKSMALYATYVDKNLQEDDPAPANQYDAKNNDILDLLANDNHGSTLHNVTVDRKFPGGMYSTICLPFDLPVANLPAQLKDADIMAFVGVTETNDEGGEAVAILNFVSLEEYWQLRDPNVTDLYMEAGIPYLICPKRDVTDAYLTYSGLMQWRFFDSSRKPLSETYNGVTFQGVFNPTTLSYGDYILVADNRLAKVTNTSGQLKGFRGYFKIEDAYLSSLADNGKLYLSMKKPVTSSVPVAPEAEQQLAPKARKIMRDGNIYILRGDEVYTIGGVRVK